MLPTTYFALFYSIRAVSGTKPNEFLQRRAFVAETATEYDAGFCLQWRKAWRCFTFVPLIDVVHTSRSGRLLVAAFVAVAVVFGYSGNSGGEVVESERSWCGGEVSGSDR